MSEKSRNNKNDPKKPTTNASREILIQNMARDYTAMKAAKDALETQNNDLLAKIDEMALNQPREESTPGIKQITDGLVRSELKNVDDDEIYDVFIKNKYRKEREENEKLRAILIAHGEKHKETTTLMQPFVSNPNVELMMRAVNDVRKAERVVREQEKIIQKLEDLLQRSKHTIDIRHKSEVDELYNMTLHRPRYHATENYHGSGKQLSNPALEYKVDMLEHSLSNEKNKVHELEKFFENEKNKRKESEVVVSQTARANISLQREIDDLRRQLDRAPHINPLPFYNEYPRRY